MQVARISAFLPDGFTELRVKKPFNQVTARAYLGPFGLHQ
jgi:hypothetical protein